MKYNQLWQARAIRPDGCSEWFSAQVPGNVQYDYGVYMGWGNIHYNDNSTLWRETEDYTWEYRTVLNYACKTGEKAVFVSKGIDYRFDILVNGKVCLSHEGMFSPVEADLSDVQPGSELVVRIYPHPKREGADEGCNQADHSAKAPVCYGWDWHPRLLVSGLWQEAYVETRDAGFIRRCEPFYTLNADRTHASLRFETEADAEVEITLFDPDGNEVGKGQTFEIGNPRLWWCNGQGKPELYTYTARTASHEVKGHIGFRTVKLVMNKGGWDPLPGFPMGRNVAPIQIELNGRNVFAKGSNWVNPDVFNGRIDYERYETLVTLAKDAHMNIFRCWGGSGTHKEMFYELCDKMGIMVWAEFPLACNCYPDDPHYLEVLDQEANAIIRMLRPHPAVVMYCGGNELFNNWSLMTDQSQALRLLNKKCYDLDKDRPYLMTSPVLGMGHGGYTFWNPNTNQDVFTIFQNAKCTAYTEFGVPNMTDLENLKKIIPEEELFPIKPEGSWKLHHAFDAWGELAWLCPDGMQHFSREKLDVIEKMIAQSNWMQCEGYKAIFEEARRQAPYCCMAINWCYCEPWITASGNSLITYPVQPKPAYYAVQKSLRPVLASARIPRFDWKKGELFHAELWLLNDSVESANQTVKVSVRANGEEYELFTWETGNVDANTNKIGPTVNWKLPEWDTDRFTLVLSCGEASSEYTLCFRPDNEW